MAKRRRARLGFTPQQHTKLEREERAKADDLLRRARDTARRGECTSAVLFLAQGERKAGMAWANALNHIGDMAPFSRLLALADDIRQDVTHNCTVKRRAG